MNVFNLIFVSIVLFMIWKRKIFIALVMILIVFAVLSIANMSYVLKVINYTKRLKSEQNVNGSIQPMKDTTRMMADLAMMKALKEVKKMPAHTSKEEIIEIAEGWKPYRSIASMILWHYYIKSRKIRM